MDQLLGATKKRLKDFKELPEDEWDFCDATSKTIGKKVYRGVFIQVTDGSLWYTDKPNPYSVETVYVKVR